MMGFKDPSVTCLRQALTVLQRGLARAGTSLLLYRLHEPSPQRAELNPTRPMGFALVREEFPLMVVLSIIYPCNFGCPNCPYTDGNSEIRKFYHDREGDLMPEKLWNKIATEAGPHAAWLRCTGGGEPMLHPRMTDMIEFAKVRGARVWLNTNGTCFGPSPIGRKKLERIVAAGIDLIEFSMDAGDAETYTVVRPPRAGRNRSATRSNVGTSKSPMSAPPSISAKS